MANSIPTMQELLEAGVHFGHKVSRAHPRMSSYIYGARDGVSIIDLAKSEEKLKEAVEFVHELGKSGGVLLVVGTKKQAKEIVETLAKEAGAAYLTSHWLGGLLTNFDEIKKNLNKIVSLKEQKEKGTLQRNKKELLLISRKIEKFERDFGGVAILEKAPEAMFIVDAVSDLTAVMEGYKLGVSQRMQYPDKKGIKLVGFADTNSNPSLLDYPIPANDDGIKSIKIICETILNAYAEGKKKGVGDREQGTEEKAPPTPSDKTSQAKKTNKKEAKIGNIEEPKVEVKLDEQVAEEAAVLEEVIEKKAIQESERKVE